LILLRPTSLHAVPLEAPGSNVQPAVRFRSS
jgi:hypothetical protein